MEDRINQLESLTTLQDDTIAQLSGELFRQQQEMARLHQRIEALERKLEHLKLHEETAGNERPPHW